MGVPSFFKWLLKRYPKSVVDAVESNSNADSSASSSSASNDSTTASSIPPPSSPNPLIDNLYLDMNGIIHPCCHPEEGGSFTEEQMIERIWAYVERLVNITRPQKLLYLAIDGVAPRAKLNQQRSRRFRSAKEATDKSEVRKKLAKEWQQRGFKLPEHISRAGEGTDEWDINVITPGTEFMTKVALALHYHTERALQFNPAFKHLTVLISDSSVPGEGEHKLMSFVRSQRKEAGYNPNTRHCIYGMDADLIMLGLATHERYFYVVRETVQDKGAAGVKCSVCGDMGHYSDQCRGEKWQVKKQVAPAPSTVAASSAASPTPIDLTGAVSPSPSPSSPSVSPINDPLIPSTTVSVAAFQFVHLPILREYLTRDLSLPPSVIDSLPFPYNFENILDDFILLCMFVGNDFLPHLPSLEIREGAIEALMKIYKELLPKMKNYLSTNGIVNLEELQLLLIELGAKENEIFSRRKSKEEHHTRKDNEQKERIRRIRDENKRREKELNKFAKGEEEQSEVKKDGDKLAETSSSMTSLPLPPMPVQPPLTSGFIHPSRQQSDPTNTTRNNIPAPHSEGTVAPPPTPATPSTTTPSAAVPIPAPKANLSAAAALRMKLKAGKPSATPATAASSDSSSTVAVDTSSSMDTSSVSVIPSPASTPLNRLQSDPIPCATKAMQGLSHDDNEMDQTEAKANERVDAIMKQTGSNSHSLLGKRKEHDVITSPVKQNTHHDENSMDTTNADDSSSLNPSPPAVTLSTSPPIELPLKRSKTSETGAAVTSAPSTVAKDESKQEDEEQSYGPNDTDEYGNLISSQSFDEYFSTKWDQYTSSPPGISKEDTVQFGVSGWKQRYYLSKLKFDYQLSRNDPISSDAREGFNLWRSYIEGLCWVLSYYYHGPSSWCWYYPYHYAPLAEDLGVFLQEGNMKSGITWTVGAPFQSVAQLMAVLPSKSRHAVPKAVQALMTSSASSPLHEFYPDTFDLDLNGKKFLWQAIALLPFIDETLLLQELKKVEHTFTKAEQERNGVGKEYLFVNSHTKLAEEIQKRVYEPLVGANGLQAIRTMKDAELLAHPAVPIDNTQSDGRISGCFHAYSHASLPSLSSVLFSPSQSKPTQKLEVISAIYHESVTEKRHQCALLPGIDAFVSVLSENDLRTLVDKREYVPRNNWNQSRYNQNMQNGNNTNQQNQNGGSVQHQHHNRRAFSEKQQAERRAYAVMSQLSKPLQVRMLNGPQPNANGFVSSQPVAASPQMTGYYYSNQVAPHLVGHALNPAFYPPPQNQVMLYPTMPPPGVVGGLPMPPMPMPMPVLPPVTGGVVMMPVAQPMQMPMSVPMPQPMPMMMPPPQPVMYQPMYQPMPMPMAPPPSFAVQTFLSAPPPPGHQVGYIPPPMHIPGFTVAAPASASAAPATAPAQEAQPKQ